MCTALSSIDEGLDAKMYSIKSALQNSKLAVFIHTHACVKMFLFVCLMDATLHSYPLLNHANIIVLQPSVQSYQGCFCGILFSCASMLQEKEAKNLNPASNVNLNIILYMMPSAYLGHSLWRSICIHKNHHREKMRKSYRI